MLDPTQAQAVLAASMPEVKVQDWARYKDLYLFRVSYPDPDEDGYDPFISVDSETGWVQDFSVINDGDISEIARAFADSPNKANSLSERR